MTRKMIEIRSKFAKNRKFKFDQIWIFEKFILYPVNHFVSFP